MGLVPPRSALHDLKSVAVRPTVSLITLGLMALPLTLPGCSWAPIQAVTSLSPAVQADTLGYNDAVGSASDRILLSNILRAKYLEPLNLSQLSSVSGTLALSGSLGFTLPWGKANMMGQNSAMPSVTGSTQPIYALSPLNTQGFTLTILQPVSQAYILNRWQAGLPRELLLFLFIKEIDFPVLKDDHTVISTKRYINDPDNEPHFAEFRKLISALMTARAELKAIDVLDPVGPPFSLYAAVTSTQNPPTTPATSTNVDQNAFGLITGSNDGQYHVGNADSPTLSDGGQLYRVYSGQVELCVDAQSMAEGGFPIPKIAPALPTVIGLQRNLQAEQESAVAAKQVARPMAAAAASVVAASAQGGGGSKGGGGGAGGGGGGGGAASASASSSQGMTAALQAGRVSALVSSEGCHADQVVLKKFTEKEFADASKRFVHIQWRSVSEIFDYLGAILRYNDRQSSPTQAAPFHFTLVPDPTVMSTPDSGQSYSEAILFAVYKNVSGNLYVNHGNEFFVVRDTDPAAPGIDYTMPILAMLSTLVNYASQPSTISTSTPLRLLPIP
jgi:hypothetical protein